MNRVICLGNRLIPGDRAGPRVHDRLSQRGPAGVELVDGGTAGLNLLRFVEGCQRVVFVDSVSGFGEPGEVLLLDVDEAAATAGDTQHHGAGLGYLLRILPAVVEGPMPDIRLVGIEVPADDDAITRAADIALDLTGARVSHQQEQEAGGPHEPGSVDRRFGGRPDRLMTSAEDI